MKTVNTEMLSNEFLFATQKIIFEADLVYSGRAWDQNFGWMLTMWDDPLSMLLFGCVVYGEVW